MDKGTSVTSALLQTRPMQFLGRISLSLYLIHGLLIDFCYMAMNGGVMKQFAWNEDEILKAYESKSTNIYDPVWGPIILLIVSPPIAFLITKFFEEPMARLLKGK